MDNEEEPSCTTTVHVDIDPFIWMYMSKSVKYQSRIEAVRTEHHVSVTDDGAASDSGKKALIVTGDSAESARMALLELASECQQSVDTYIVSSQDADRCNVITENAYMLDDPESALIDVDPTAGLVRLTGTKDEIKHALGFLEVYGVAVPSDLAPDVPIPVDETPPQSLQLWKEEEERDHGTDEDDSIYVAQQSDTPKVLVDARLWSYLNNSTGRSVAEISEVREKMSVNIAEGLQADEGSVTLTFSGIEDDVAEAMDRMRQIIDRHRDSVQTVDVLCPDSAVRAKVVKFLPKIKSAAHIVVESDDRMTATGTAQDLDEFSSKLSKLGASLHRETPSSQEQTPNEDEAVPASPWPHLENGAGTESGAAGQDLEADERAARQLQAEEDAKWQDYSAPSASFAGHPDSDSGQRASSEGKQFGEIPVPIEEILWTYVQKRREKQLQDLRDACQVRISSHPAAQEGLVVINIEAESETMLSVVQEELIQLLESLRSSIVVQVLQSGDEQGGGGRQLPQQVAQLFDKLADGTDAIIQVNGSNIIIAGPQDAAAECQQKIAAFVQQAQQGRGGGGGGFGGAGGFGGGEALGHGRGGRMELPSDVSDADMARFMRNRGMQMPGNPGGGADDMMHGIMGRSMGGGPAAYGGMPGLPQGASFPAPVAGQSRDSLGMVSGPAMGPMRRSAFDAGDQVTQDMFDTERRNTEAEFNHDLGGTRMDRMSAAADTVQQQQQQRPRDEERRVADEERVTSRESKPRVVSFADEKPIEEPHQAPVCSTTDRHVPERTQTISAHTCSVCNQPERGAESSQQPCEHAFCVSCVQQYFTDGQQVCPVCGGSDDHEQARDTTASQPPDGVMLVTYDNAFRLPGYETTSRGTIVVSYSFPSGVQKDLMPHPGRKYNGTSKSAFFPLSMEGSNVVELLQRAFDKRLLFSLVPSSDGKTDEITWNGIHHKTSIYGGPQICGYPDPIYMKRVQHELLAKGLH